MPSLGGTRWLEADLRDRGENKLMGEEVRVQRLEDQYDQVHHFSIGYLLQTGQPFLEESRERVR